MLQYEEEIKGHDLIVREEIRKNSHLHYWIPEDIMLVKGQPLKTALKHLEVHNLKRMNNIKKH